MISRKLTRRLEELEARRQVKKPLRVVVRYVDGASDSSDPPQPEDDSHEIIQIVVEYVDLPAKTPRASLGGSPEQHLQAEEALGWLPILNRILSGVLTREDLGIARTAPKPRIEVRTIT